MYTKDKNTRITLRLNEQQFDFVKCQSDALGVSPSEFLRMVVNLVMTSSNQVDNEIEEIIKKGNVRRENEKTDSNNIL